MLQPEDKRKLEDYIDNTIAELKEDAERVKRGGLSGRQMLEEIIKTTVCRLAPDSKIILSSAYNMMAERTLAEAYFSDSAHKAAFYQADILTSLIDKFNFEVPAEIDCRKLNAEADAMVKSGTVAVSAGGIVSIVLKSCAAIKSPGAIAGAAALAAIDAAGTVIGIAAILTGIMVLVRKKRRHSAAGSSIDEIIDEYYAAVKYSLLAWIDAAAEYYDQAVAELKERG